MEIAWFAYYPECRLGENKLIVRVFSKIVSVVPLITSQSLHCSIILISYTEHWHIVLWDWVCGMNDTDN